MYLCAVYMYIVICRNETFVIVFTGLIYSMYWIYILELENQNIIA